MSKCGRRKFVFSLSIAIIRPPGTVVPDGLMFYPWCIFRPPVYGSNGRSYKMLVMFFFFLFFRHAFSEFPRPIALKLCHLIGICVYFIMQVQKLGGHSPQKIWGQKHAKFPSILDHFRLWSRISPERLKISKIGRRYKLWQFLLRLTKKVRWTLVH